MKPKYLISLAIASLFLAGYWGWNYLTTPTAGSLAGRALAAEKPEERMQALAELVLLPDPEVMSQLQRLAKDSKDSQIVLAALNKLSVVRYVNSLPLFLRFLDHDDERVRETAYSAIVAERQGMQLEYVGYLASDHPEKRGAAAQKIRQMTEQGSEKKSKAGVAVAAANVPSAPVSAAPSPIPAKKEEIKEPPAPEPVAPPSPSVSIVPVPAPPAVVSFPTAPANDNPSLVLLAWLCRGLAVLAVLAQVVGAMILLRREWLGLAPADRPTPVATGGAKTIVVAAPAAGAPSEIDRLFRGVVFGVGLLIVAELILMAGRMEQTARSIEQKLDYVSRSRP